MLTKDLVVTNETGIHARPAAAIVQLASQFQSDITFIKDDVQANAKSIMNILLLAAEPNSSIQVEVDGSDETEAMEAMSQLFEMNFHDDE
jgi:phosphocarrier protein